MKKNRETFYIPMTLTVLSDSINDLIVGDIAADEYGGDPVPGPAQGHR